MIATIVLRRFSTERMINVFEYWTDEDYTIIKEMILPVSVKNSKNVENVDELLKKKSTCISFSMDHCANFTEKGAN